MAGASGVQTYPVEYAEGGKVSREAEDWKNTREERARTDRVQGEDRTQRAAPRRSALEGARNAAGKADDAVGRFTGRAAEGSGAMRRIGAGARRLGAAGALGATALETATTDTERYRERFGLETDDPSLLGDIGVRALGMASDLGNALTFGAAGKLYRDKQADTAGAPAPVAAAAAPTEAAPEPMNFGDAGGDSGWLVQTSAPAVAGPSRSALPTYNTEEPLDFSQLDVDARDLPDMKLDDWKRYRAEMTQAAQASGKPDAVGKVDQMITQMQQRGFMNYAQQGLALQQAGNIRGAMAAYRAAYQYFPVGYDVEFGTMKGRDGQMIIVGTGLDEKTGKIVPGTQMVMDPERVATIIENFTNPQAFRAWTKDWREFQKGERQYHEITKPLAQAQADALTTNATANMMDAESRMIKETSAGGLDGADRRAAEKTFRDRLAMLGLQDEAKADFLASVMSMVKVQNPSVPDNAIVQAIMQADRDGTLEQRLSRMGVAPAAPAPAQPATRAARPDSSSPPRRALSPEPAAAPTGPPPGIPNAVWNNALRDNGGDARRAYSALSGYNDLPQ